MLTHQPIGVFPGLAGFFLLPRVDNMEQYANKLLMGFIPENLPQEWEFFMAAINGESEADVLALINESKEGFYNRFILMPNDETYEDAVKKLENDEDYSKLLSAVAWRMQIIDRPPKIQDIEGQLKAFILASLAYDQLQNEHWEEGLATLHEAALSSLQASPIFAARLLSEYAATRQTLGLIDEETIQSYEKAIQLINASPFKEMKGELQFQLGTLYQELASSGESSYYLKAIQCYNKAVQLYDKQAYPEEFALTHMNLALAYLGVPGHTDKQQLRIATAIQSLRESLRYFKKDAHLDYWASATINLANTLQYAKSSHIEDNLWEAVSLYEEVLAVRDKANDPIGYARLIANQATALSHLGAFTRAVPQLKEAQSIFLEEGEIEAAEAIEVTLNEIRKKKQKN